MLGKKQVWYIEGSAAAALAAPLRAHYDLHPVPQNKEKDARALLSAGSNGIPSVWLPTLTRWEKFLIHRPLRTQIRTALSPFSQPTARPALSRTSRITLPKTTPSSLSFLHLLLRSIVERTLKPPSTISILSNAIAPVVTPRKSGSANAKSSTKSE